MRAPSDATADHGTFSFRLSAGGGGAGATRDLSGGEYRVRGLAGLVGVDVGVALNDHVSLYGHVGGLAFNHLSLEDSPNAGSGYVALLGPSVLYRFLPSDWYASGTLDLAVMAVTDATGHVQNSSPGIGFELEVGQAWPATVGESDWSVGLGLRFTYAVLPASRGIPEPEESWQTTALSGLFTVGYD